MINVFLSYSSIIPIFNYLFLRSIISLTRLISTWLVKISDKIIWKPYVSEGFMVNLYKLKRTLSRHIFYLVIIFTTTANNPKKDSENISKFYFICLCLSYTYTLLVCLSFCFYPINVKTAMLVCLSVSIQ